MINFIFFNVTTMTPPRQYLSTMDMTSKKGLKIQVLVLIDRTCLTCPTYVKVHKSLNKSQ